MRQSIHTSSTRRHIRFGVAAALALTTITGFAASGSDVRQVAQPAPTTSRAVSHELGVTTSSFTTSTTDLAPKPAQSLPVTTVPAPVQTQAPRPPRVVAQPPQPIRVPVRQGVVSAPQSRARTLPASPAASLPLWARSCPFWPGFRLRPDPRCADLKAYLDALAQSQSLSVPATGYELGGYGPPAVPDALAATPGGISWFKAEYARWARNAWCIISRESLHAGGPVAQNPDGNASGWFQFKDGTWGYFQGYRKARFAPSDVQWWRFFQVWNERAGRGAWYHPQCW